MPISSKIEVTLVELLMACMTEMVWSSSPAVAGHVMSVVCRLIRPAKSKPSRYTGLPLGAVALGCVRIPKKNHLGVQMTVIPVSGRV